MKPKFPCSQNCEHRQPGCHSEKCPFGWLEYEAAMNKHREERRGDFILNNYLHERNIRVQQHQRKLNLKEKNR